jgi:hypothetical protein
MEPEKLLLMYSDEAATSPYSEPDESSPHPHTLFRGHHLTFTNMKYPPTSFTKPSLSM